MSTVGVFKFDPRDCANRFKSVLLDSVVFFMANRPHLGLLIWGQVALLIESGIRIYPPPILLPTEQ